jgi:hypothetical protein
MFLRPTNALAQKQVQSPRILSAKTVYFDNETGSDAVGKNALAQLRKWGKFVVVPDLKSADLILLHSYFPQTLIEEGTSSFRVGRLAESTVRVTSRKSEFLTTISSPLLVMPISQ